VVARLRAQARLARQRHRNHRVLAQTARQFLRIGVEPRRDGPDSHRPVSLADLAEFSVWCAIGAS
jgi:hypothetical protein